MMSQAFEFLDEPFTIAFEPAAPVNVFSVAGFPRRETVASNVLAFLLDPNERHGFGTTFVDAVLVLLGDALTTAGDRFDADACRGSSEWSVATEARTDDRTRIDILLENDALDVAIVIENKVDATIANPFGTYVAHASRSHGTVVAAVLAPTRRDLAAVTVPGIVAIAYDDLFDAADAALYDVGPMADQRSLELYAQFRETTSERIATMTIEHEQQRLDELWSAIEHRQDQVLDFFTALESVNAVLAARGARLQEAIGQRLDATGIAHSSWLVTAGDHAWGRSRGERALVYVGFKPRTGGSIELLVGWLPRTGTFGYAVKAYQSRNRPTRPWDHIPLGLPFDADEDAVADRFAQLALRWTAGERPD
ncbi:PD-(D/E)XK nuclease family protein [Agrococcus jejuensis]|uniref:PD-(D/E)XK nuclease superfamily protein n=1 Tax=Agrococcus jejuensis TaxID=399736 RepID=A0A1G8CIL7_9MICO|nr:PD-(D/E)XK nuclease family protein [Agrococcus jejuensis]SDH44750.1 PD-(D/E)XK nuclease superfamily protein [Agrococcus jejuensis]